MSIYHRIKRWLGYDTTLELTRELPRIEFDVEHTNGETTTAVAHGYKTDDSVLRFYEHTEPVLYTGPMGPDIFLQTRQTHTTLASVKRIHGEKVATDTFRFVVDKADGSILSKETP